MTLRTLDALVAAAGAERFLEHLASRRRLFMPGGSGAAAAELLPWPELDRLIACDSVRPGRLKVVLRNRELAPELFRDGAAGALRSDTLMALAEQGATLLFNMICEKVPAIGELATAVERRLDRYVGVNCYASFGAHSAFESHTDDHDVVVIQLHGSKHWRCYGAAASAGEPEWEGVLAPGDVLFVPQGDAHAALPVDRPSVHLTFGISRTMDPEAVRHTRPVRPVAAFDLARRLQPSSVLVPALRRRIDLQHSESGEVELRIGGRPVRLRRLPRLILAAAVEAERITLADLAVRVGAAADTAELSDAVCDLGRKGLIGLGT